MPKKVEKVLALPVPICHTVFMAKSKRVGKLTLTRADGSKEYLGGVFKFKTSFPGNASVSLAVFAEEGDGFDKVVKLVTEGGREIDLEGFLNISARL